MTKEEKENWTLDNFIINYNKELNNNYKLSHRVPQKEYPGPDFILSNPKQDKRGVEVTELLEYPAENSGHQRYLEKHFHELLESKIDKNKFQNYYFIFHYTEYPNEKKLEGYADMALEQINKALADSKSIIREGKILKIAVGSQIIGIGKKADDGTGPSFLFFMFGEDGVTDFDRENFFKGLREIIDEKNIASKKYNKEQMNILVIYDNTRYGMFIHDIKKEIFDEFKVISSEEFKEIWLLSGMGDKVFRIN